MKINLWLLSFTILILVVFTTGFNIIQQKENITGAWKWQDAEGEQVLLFIDGYFTHTSYHKANKKFIQTRGGTYLLNNGRVTMNIEFDTHDKERINKSETYSSSISGKQLTMEMNGQKSWNRIDEGKAPLAGVWRITGRMQEGKIVPIQQTGSRKTLKILTGTRFQWAAINPETKEFFGTGGGTYTFANRKYTEQIEFFSRDSSRVGASLQFDGQIKDGNWHHSGLSSRGEKIYEIWSRIQ
jgi:hypothetical protein